MTIDRRRPRFVLALAAAVLAFAGIAAADEHAESIRKIDVAAVAETGQVDAGLSVASSGQPTEAALEQLSRAGFKAVVDLRSADERRGIDEQTVVEGLGMSYIPLPVTSGDDMSFETAQRLDEILEAADGPVLVHCGSGNRVGALIALRASAKGASDEEALEAGRKAGLTGAESLVKERLAGKADE